jgi:transcription initiation factor IIE alpha subunit
MSLPTANNSTVTIVSSSPLFGTKKEALASASMKDIQGAVYSHIQAIRALGRTDINTEEIAKALSIPVVSVNSVIAKLKEKGVRIAR